MDSKEKRTIKVNFVDFWEGLDFKTLKLYKILDKHYNPITSDKPDYLFCSSFYFDEHLNYNNCLKILYSVDDTAIDYIRYHYNIDSNDDVPNGRQHLYCPAYFCFAENFIFEKMKNKHLDIQGHEDELLNRDFCSLVYCNEEPITKLIQEELDKYRKVNYLEGFDYINVLEKNQEDKYDFLKKYKFSIVCENEKKNGYITEKVLDAFAAKTIPIYYGADNVNKYFNPEAMIIIKDEDDIDNAIERIKQIDEDDELYLHMLKQPAILPGKEDFFEETSVKLEEFICRIIDADFEKELRVANILKMLHLIHFKLQSRISKLFNKK